MASSPLTPEQKLERRRVTVRQLYGFAVALVLLAGFLVSASPVRNSDFWLHLASGRLVTQGQLPVGTDPFSYTAAEVAWVNPSWLYDVLLYAVHAVGGAIGVMVAKSLLVGSAVFLVWRQSGKRPLWTGLAVVALAPWLVFQPLLASLLMLALVRGTLDRLRDLPTLTLKHYRTLFGLCWLWANLDEWWVLGPILILISAVGRVADRRTVLKAAGLAFVVCLLTPNHVRIVRLPSMLGFDGVLKDLVGESLVPGILLSPLDLTFWKASAGVSAGGYAFALMWVLGLLGMVVGRKRVRREDAVVWVLFAGLCLLRARLIPLFAVATVPLLARWLSYPSLRESLRAGTLAAFASVAVVAGAWTGTLSPAPYSPRSWAVEPDASLKMAAEQVRAERLAGDLDPQARTMCLNPELAHYLAWYAPGEKTFFDSRLNHFRSVAGVYAAVRQGLYTGKGDFSGKSWREWLKEYRVERILISDTEPQRAIAAMGNLLDTDQTAPWKLVRTAGRVAFVARPTWPERALDIDRLAYEPTPATMGPPSWAGRDPLPPLPGDPFFRRRLPRSADRDEAGLWLQYSDILRGQNLAKPIPEWQVSAFAGSTTATIVRPFLRPYMDQTPQAPLVLSIRAAQRALAANPDDAGAWLVLGEAINRQGNLTREESWQALLPHLGQLRRGQALAALRAAVRLNPKLEAGHELLIGMYQQDPSAADLTLEHLRLLTDLRAAKPRPGGDAGREYDEQRKRSELEIYRVGNELAKRRQKLDEISPSLKIAERARQAVQLGLAGRAIEILVESDISAFGVEGMLLELELFLATGRIQELREFLNEDQIPALSETRWYWIAARMHLASGDYEAADRDLAVLADRLPIARENGSPVSSSRSIASVAGRMVLLGMGRTPAVGEFEYQESTRMQMLSLQYEQASIYREASELAAVRGILRLERGDVAQARKHFAEALILGDPFAGGVIVAKSGLQMMGRE